MRRVEGELQEEGRDGRGRLARQDPLLQSDSCGSGKWLRIIVLALDILGGSLLSICMYHVST